MTGFGDALAALEASGIRYRLRRDHGEVPEEGELDLWMRGPDLRAAGPQLRAVGFHPFTAPGHPGHHFRLRFDRGRWMKLDVKLEDYSPRFPEGVIRRGLIALARRGPAAPRRMGPMIAILGPDGAGKGTVVAALKERIPIPVVVLYMGARRRGLRRTTPATGSVIREAAGQLRRVIRKWRLLLRGYVAAWRGWIVLMDRHPIEALAVKPSRGRLAAVLEGLLILRPMPWPDAIVVLDAPADVLYARKREHSLDILERWRRGYLESFGSRATVVSTAQPPERTVDQVSGVVWEQLTRRRQW